MLRSAGAILAREVHVRAGTVNLRPEMGATQSHKDESDINRIVKRYGLMAMSQGVPLPPSKLEFATSMTFHEVMQKVRDGQESFMRLAPAVRNRFGGDPAAFVEWCDERDEEGNRVNLVEMRRLGIAMPEPVKVESQPVKVEVVNKPEEKK